MIYFTICARNYLAYALTLRESLLAAVPGARFIIFLADAPSDDLEIAEFTVPVEQIAIPNLQQMTFRYTLMEFSTAIKPFCFQHIFDQLKAERAVYLDPDIKLFAPLDPVTEALDKGADAVLTPHILSPLNDPHRPSDLDILRSGTFNLGFAAFSNSARARDFIDWWARQLEDSCLVDLESGLFVDQKFVDFAPSFLSNLAILRHAGCNVAYWNLSHRPITIRDGQLFAGADPLIFFHFSGVVPGNRGIFSKHQDRFGMESAGAAAGLVETYLADLERNHHARWSKTPYAFANFDDGTPIPAAVRRSVSPSEQPPIAFDADFWTHADGNVDQDADLPITRLMTRIHKSRPDLQAQYPLSNARDRQAYADWFRRHGMREYGLAPDMLTSAARAGSGWKSTARRLVAGMRRRLGV